MKIKPTQFKSGIVFYNSKFEIIAQHNLNIEGIPHVDVGELEWLDKIQPNYDKKESYQHGFHDAIQVVKDYYQANKKEFSREQMEQAIKMARDRYNEGGPAVDRYRDEEILQSLQPKIESIEPETQFIKYTNKLCVNKCASYPSDCLCDMESKEQYITYQRDCKTFIKAKINYETN